MARKHESASTALEALLCLRPAGAKSFEELICLLLSDLAQTPYRRVRAGHQGGVDSKSESGVGVEVKRYQGKLDERNLLGELGQVGVWNPDLEIWALVTTVEVPGDLTGALQSRCDELGIGFLCLDASRGRPLECPAIVALAAANPARLAAALTDSEWIDSRQPFTGDIDAVLEELRWIHADPQFDEWARRLRAQLCGLPTWDRVRRQQNHRLLRRIAEESALFFGTAFDRERAVPREAESELSDWLMIAATAAEPKLGVVLGERYDGKTWAVLHWLLETLETCPLPVFMFGAKTADQGRDLIDLVIDEVAEVLNVTVPQAGRIVRRIRKPWPGVGPWAAIVLDGLNEYRARPDAPWEHIHNVASPFDEQRRPAAVLVTARTKWWEDSSQRLRQAAQATRIDVGPYTEAELRIAVEKLGEGVDVLATVPASARSLLRRPRYLALVIEHRDRLRDFGVITADVLHYLDTFDKMRDHAYLAAAVAWDHQAYSEFLSSLARDYLAGHGAAPLARSELNTLLDSIVEERRAALRDLESAGVVIQTGRGYEVDRARLATGMGLWLPKALFYAGRRGAILREELRELLEPMAETDEKVEWLKAAVTFILIDDSAERADSEVLQVLLDEWLRSRNLDDSILQDLQALARHLLPALVELAPRTWSDRVGDRRLQEISLLVFVRAVRQHPSATDRTLIDSAASRWCRLVPRRGTRFLRKGDDDDAEAEVQRRIDQSIVTSLGLTLAEDEGVLDLQSVALYLESLVRGLLNAEDILAILAVGRIAENPLDSAEIRVARQVLGRRQRDWFEKRYYAIDVGEIWKRTWSNLVRIAARADLAELGALVTPPPNPAYEEMWARYRFTLEDYTRQALVSPAPDENLLRFAANARRFVLDPDMPKPSPERVAALSAQFKRKYANVRLHEGAAATAEDHEFGDVAPAIAAWTPDTGTAVIQTQVAGLPERFTEADQAENVYFTHILDRHAAALFASAPLRLLEIGRRSYTDDHRQFAACLALASILPGRPAKERLHMITGHTLQHAGDDWEWRDLYELAAFMADAPFRRTLLAHLEEEHEARTTIRLRLLFSEVGGLILSERQRDRCLADLFADDAMSRYSAVATLAASSPTVVPSDSLVGLLRNEDPRGSLTPRYASYLLVRQGEYLDHLPVFWRAYAAVRYPERREQFLYEVEKALQGTMLKQHQVNVPAQLQIRLRSGYPVVQTVGVSSAGGESVAVFGSSRVGVGGLADSDPVDFKTVMEDWQSGKAIEKKNQLAAEAATRFAAEAHEHEYTWASELFPQTLVDSLPEVQFLRWAGLIISTEFHGYDLWTGLAQSMLCRALRDDRPVARELFGVVYPFQRRSYGGGVTFSVDDVDFTLHTLFHPDSAGSTARSLLEDLLLDCRSDLEFHQVALAARRGRVKLLDHLVQDWLGSDNDDLRARAARLAGWLPGLTASLADIATQDPSLHVRGIADEALCQWVREQWAREWFARFVSEDEPTARWGAGQLFLECADRRVLDWAWPELERVRRTRVRGEGFLLLRAVRQEAQRVERKLGDTFLGAKVSELRNLCHPWRPEASWHRLRPTE